MKDRRELRTVTRVDVFGDKVEEWGWRRGQADVVWGEGGKRRGQRPREKSQGWEGQT